MRVGPGVTPPYQQSQLDEPKPVSVYAQWLGEYQKRVAAIKDPNVSPEMKDHLRAQLEVMKPMLIALGVVTGSLAGGSQEHTAASHGHTTHPQGKPAPRKTPSREEIRLNTDSQMNRMFVDAMIRLGGGG